ncbi:tetratricopeptide repeat protein [Streptomyces albicerus]|uniref:tetratricopeptide repeat protein n=1 Tax=Streptomyces albicerus TaxID=2569859 RepID=UPI00124BA9F5|nr:tetratricopeptide repeat protein [Streptomyces albicerus]
MLEPMSVAAVAGVLGAVGSGMANEAGKWAWESAGGLVRRIAGREVAAPGNPDEVAAVARVVSEGVRRDPQLARAWVEFAGGVRAPGVVVGRPCLPPSIRSFTDRRDALKRLDEEARRKADGRPRLALLYGPEGMGVTTLAKHWGVRAAERFPDGQIYVDLRGGGTGTPLDAARVLGEVLRQLGLPDEELPPAFTERQELFRRYAADRRLLVILDHARSAAQVEPVIGSAPEVFTIVGARHRPTGLDALPIPVGPLTERDSERLLAALVDKSAIAAARATMPSLLARCAGSPYAIKAAAPRLFAATQEASAVSPETDPVRAAAEDSYRMLTPGVARLYRLAALCDLPALDAAGAARAAGTQPAEAEGWLEELADTMLLERVDDGRYQYREGVRAHAEAVAAREDGIVACSAAMNRTVEGYLLRAVSAARAVLPESWRIPELPAGAVAVPYADRGEALDALAAEAGNLVRVMGLADEFGDGDTVVRLGRALWPLQLKAGHHDVLLPALRIAVRVADERFPGTREAGALHAQLAHTLTELRLWDEAEREAVAAARDERAAGHPRGHASAVEFLGLLRLRQWRFQEAYGCFEESYGIYAGIGPEDEGAGDLPRALALLERHRGRALRGLQRREEAGERLERALAFFRESGEAYNTARTLTDLAETRLDGEEFTEALPLIDEAIAALAEEKAEYHLAYLRVLRERCVGVRPE